MANHGVQDVWTIPIAAGVAGAIGLLAGIPALRLPGLYLALATFGIAVVLPTILQEVRPLHRRLDGHLPSSAGRTETGHGAGVTILGGI